MNDIVTIGLLPLFLVTSTALAAEPGKPTKTAAGEVYVDDNGMTLYTFDKDEIDKSKCYGECAVKWPSYLAEAGAKAEGDWTLVNRKDGSRMWAYENKPLYTYIDDKQSGDVTGDGKGGVWHVAKPD
jgi:predicted lipoprotein with Yx(FWY)xxD motif